VTVLVTGATGFVGAQVVRELVASGEEVVALVRANSPRWRLDGISERVNFIVGDLDQGASLVQELKRSRPTACIHAAWYAEPGKYLASPLNLDSLRGSLTLLEHLADAGCRHIVGVGTCFEYDMKAQPLTEDSATRPFTLYAACKLAFKLIAEQRTPQLDMRFAWTRLFYLYGPREDERRLVPAAIKALTTGQEFPTTSGQQIRDYLHIADVASALCALSKSRATGAFNVCSADPITIAALVETIGEQLGRQELIRLGAYPDREWDPPKVTGDNTRLRQQTGWAPRFGLREGLAETIDWWSAVHPPA
jgi:nucleoside-diphosphate-sugar epimerase